VYIIVGNAICIINIFRKDGIFDISNKYGFTWEIQNHNTFPLKMYVNLSMYLGCRGGTKVTYRLYQPNFP